MSVCSLFNSYQNSLDCGTPGNYLCYQLQHCQLLRHLPLTALHVVLFRVPFKLTSRVSLNPWNWNKATLSWRHGCIKKASARPTGIRRATGLWVRVMMTHFAVSPELSYPKRPDNNKIIPTVWSVDRGRLMSDRTVKEYKPFTRLHHNCQTVCNYSCVSSRHSLNNFSRENG